MSEKDLRLRLAQIQARQLEDYKFKEDGAMSKEATMSQEEMKEHLDALNPINKLYHENQKLKTQNSTLLKALKHADMFITNGIDLGYIEMPSPYSDDPALSTPGIVKKAIEEARH